MLNLISLPFRFLRTWRFGLIALGALISGLGLWMQIKGVPAGLDPFVAVLRGLVDPVLDGPATIFGIASKIGGVLALAGLLGMTVHDIAPAARLGVMDQPLPEPTEAAGPTPMQQASTWQDRLAAKTASPTPQRASRSFGSTLRMGVAGLVICGFLAVLGATFLGNVGLGNAGLGNAGLGNAGLGNAGAGNTGLGDVDAGQTGTAQSAANLSPAQAMIQGHLARAGFTPAANPAEVQPRFAIPKLDPAVIVPWVKQQLALALSGDQTAMITLGSIFGGIFVLLLGIKISFAMRRDKASQRTSTRRISYS